MDRLPSLALPGLSLSSHSLGQQSLNNHSGHTSLNSLGLHTSAGLHNAASTSVAAAAAAAASLYTTAQSGHHHIMNNSNNTRWVGAINLDIGSVVRLFRLRCCTQIDNANHARVAVSFVVLLIRRRRNGRRRSSTSNGRWMHLWSGLGCRGAKLPRTTPKCTIRKSPRDWVSFLLNRRILIITINRFRFVIGR